MGAEEYFLIAWGEIHEDSCVFNKSDMISFANDFHKEKLEEKLRDETPKEDVNLDYFNICGT